jgi:hypothetical protein
MKENEPKKFSTQPLSIGITSITSSTGSSVRTLHAIGVGFICLVLLYAVVDKLFHWSSFLTALTYYPFLPYEYRTIIAYPILLVEFTLFAGLMVPVTRAVALGGCTILFGLFTFVTYVLYRVSPGSECACFFSFGSTRADLLHVVQNIALTGLSLFLWKSPPDGRSAAKESTGDNNSRISRIDPKST